MMTALDPEEKQKRIDRLMDCTEEEIATQWVIVGTSMKEDYDKLKIKFIEYKIRTDNNPWVLAIHCFLDKLLS